MTPDFVVKLGGSLLDLSHLPRKLHTCLEEIARLESSRRAVLIVGGGRVVDALRDLDRRHELGTDKAHWLAIQALDLTASVLEAMVPVSRAIHRIEELEPCWANGVIPILAPGNFLKDVDSIGSDPLPESWEVTSDSIAARIADRLGSPTLYLLKSRILAPETCLEEAAQRGLVDPLFPETAARMARVGWINLRGADNGIIWFRMHGGTRSTTS
jgi:aspartokinase-like uncharacterized kinase